MLPFHKSAHFPAQTHPMHIYIYIYIFFFSLPVFGRTKSCPLGLEGKHVYLSLDGFFLQLLSESTVFDEPRDGDSHKN